MRGRTVFAIVFGLTTLGVSAQLTDVSNLEFSSPVDLDAKLSFDEYVGHAGTPVPEPGSLALLAAGALLLRIRPRKSASS